MKLEPRNPPLLLHLNIQSEWRAFKSKMPAWTSYLKIKRIKRPVIERRIKDGFHFKMEIRPDFLKKTRTIQPSSLLKVSTEFHRHPQLLFDLLGLQEHQ